MTIDVPPAAVTDLAGSTGRPTGATVAAPVLPQERYPHDGVPDPDFALLHLYGNHYVAIVRTT